MNDMAVSFEFLDGHFGPLRENQDIPVFVSHVCDAGRENVLERDTEAGIRVRTHCRLSTGCEGEDRMKLRGGEIGMASKPPIEGKVRRSVD